MKRQMRKVLGWLIIGWICGVTMTVLGEVVVGVKWRLREKCEFWESTLQASDTIISIIKQGYVLPLTVVQG